MLAVNLFYLIKMHLCIKKDYYKSIKKLIPQTNTGGKHGYHSMTNIIHQYRDTVHEKL